MTKLSSQWLEAALPKHPRTGISYQFQLYSKLPQPRKLAEAGLDATVPRYPASVCKLFYMYAMLYLEQNGQFSADAEDRRALEDMILHSSNEATVYLLCRLTGTENGPCLTSEQMLDWWQRRCSVQRLFAAFHWPEYDDCQLLHGTYEFSPYGREQQAREFGRNALSAAACVRLLNELWHGNQLSLANRDAAQHLLNRDWERALSDQPKDVSQVQSFIAAGISPDLQVYSKAGWTSDSRSDVIVIESDTHRLLGAVLSEGRGLAADQDWMVRLGRQLNSLF